MAITTEKAKKGISPTAGARANGYFARSPIRNVPIAEANAAAIMAPPGGRPIWLMIFGYKARMYAMERKVVNPAAISVRMRTGRSSGICSVIFKYLLSIVFQLFSGQYNLSIH